MSRKDIIIMSVLVNAGLIIILLVSSLTSKESYFVASSATVAESILDSNENGMISSVKPEDKFVPSNIVSDKIIAVEEKAAEQPIAMAQQMAEEVVHKLPEVATLEEPKVEVNELKELPIQVQTQPKENKFMEVKVKKGDTLEKIAKENNTSIPEIVKINELSNTFLRIGQTLLVPKRDSVAGTGIAKSAPKKTSVGEANYYTVKCGDNPWTIAMKHHLKVDELLKLNNLNSTTAKKLRPGDKLRIK